MMQISTSQLTPPRASAAAATPRQRRPRCRGPTSSHAAPLTAAAAAASPCCCHSTSTCIAATAPCATLLVAPPTSSRRRLVACGAAGKGFGTPAKGAAQQTPRARRKCPCGSGQTYEACCGRYHAATGGGVLTAPTPEALLRSRFSAYALQEVDYLVATTHPQNPERAGISTRAYARSLARVAKETEYLKLEIEEQEDLSTPAAMPQENQQEQQAQEQVSAQQADASGRSAFLRFSVKWRPRAGGAEQTARERSHFKHMDGTWLYYGEAE